MAENALKLSTRTADFTAMCHICGGHMSDLIVVDTPTDSFNMCLSCIKQINAARKQFELKQAVCKILDEGVSDGNY